MSTPTLLGTTIGGYRLVDFIGAGGMGEVYRAVHARIGRVVAVKVLTREAGEEQRRFENEARLQARVDHPNIATLYDFFEADGRACLVMEYVEGRTLSDTLAERGRLAPADAVAVVRQVATALACVHARGIVHRDLKPANVRVRPDGVVKVLDFGIAKGLTSRGLTGAGHVVGTPQYLAPERLRGQAATPRADVWSLGVLLHELVTGRPPYPGPSTASLWTQINEGPPPAPSSLVTGGDRALVERIDGVVARCLAVEPRARFGTAAAVAMALDGGPAPAPRLASAAGSAAIGLGPVGRLGRRHWRAAAAAAGCLVLVAAIWGATPARPPSAASALPASIDAARASGEVSRSSHRIDVMEGRADVFVNGERRGSTPLDYRATPGEVVELELRQDGFVPLRQRFDVTKKSTWTFTMARAR